MQRKATKKMHGGKEQQHKKHFFVRQLCNQFNLCIYNLTGFVSDLSIGHNLFASSYQAV